MCSLPAQQVPDKPGQVATAQLLGFVTEARLHPYKAEHRDNIWGEEVQTDPHLPAKPITGAISPSKAHLHKRRDAQGHEVIQPNKLRAWSKDCPVQALP